jgi:flagellar hook protein FlgE
MVFSTQYSANFSVQDLSQDGLPTGNLTGISINDEGVVSANFSNGGSDILGKVALTRFANPAA